MSLKVGLQMYSVKDAMAADPIAAIKEVGEAGYKFVEFANHNATEDFGCGFGVEAKVLKATLDDLGLKAISAHISPLTLDNVDKVAEYYQILGTKNLVLSADFFEGMDGVKAKADQFNAIGEALKKYDITYLYHNHFHEFQHLEGKMVLEWLKELVNPEYVGFQLDTYWAMRGGQDPVEIIKSFGTTIKSIHQKDLAKDMDIPTNVFEFVDENQIFTMPTLFEALSKQVNGYEQKELIVEIGTGKMPIQSLIDAAVEYTDAKYVILEQDATKIGEMNSIRESMKQFRRFNHISWD